MAHEFLSCVQKALLSAGYDNILLKVKQVIWLEILYLKKDLIAVLPTGYGKSLVFQVLPRLLRERDARSASTRASASVIKSVVLVVSPLNALMCDQIERERCGSSGFRSKGRKRCWSDSPVISSQWEGARERIIQAGYEIVFCHPEAFFIVRMDWKFYRAFFYLSAVKAVIVDEAHCILEWWATFRNTFKLVWTII